MRHHGSADYTEVPVGRRLKGKLRQTLDEKSLDETLGQLLAGFQPLPDRYPRNVPVVLLYPGRRRGEKGLSFMGILEPDNDYRPRIY